MAGFIPQKKTYTLDFAGTDLDGLVVTMSGLTLGEYLEMTELKNLSEGDSDGTNTMIEKFVSHLVSWNVTTDTGVAVKPTLKSVSEQDVDFVLAIIHAWTNALAGVSAPLDSSSTSGLPSQEEQIQTVSLSPSLAS